MGLRIYVSILSIVLCGFSAGFSKEYSAEFVAKVIAEALPEHSKSYIDAFIKGMEEFSLPFQQSVFYQAMERECEARWALQFKKNFLIAEQFFVSEKVGNFEEVVPNKVYFEILSKGSGAIVESLDHEVLASFEIGTLDGFNVQKRYAEKGIRYPISALMPGLAKGMIGMREGERRKIYLHPEYDFQDYLIVTNQQTLIVDVKLEKIIGVSSQPTKIELSDFSKCNLPLEHYQNEYDRAHLEFAYQYGKHVWNHYRYGQKQFGLAELAEHLRTIEAESLLDLKNEEIRRKIIDLHCLLYLNEALSSAEGDRKYCCDSIEH